jgi:hypothetical protein
MLFVTIAFMLFERPDIWLLLFSLLLISGAVAFLWHFVSEGKLFNWISAIFLVWIFASPSFVVWTTLPLMDVTLWSALLILATIVTLKATSPRVLAILISLIVLTRPEGMLWGVVFIFLFGLGILAQHGVGGLWPNLRLPLILYFLTLGALIGVRSAYFGYPLPNTYYAKVSPDFLYNLTQGGLYLANFVASNLLVMILVLGASLAGAIFKLPEFIGNLRKAPARANDNNQTRFLVVSLITFAGLLSPVWAGGDHFSLYRFYQPIWPLLILPIVAMLNNVRKPIAPAVRYGVAIGALLLLSLTPRATWANLSENYFRTEFSLVSRSKTLGTLLNELFREDPPSIGYLAAGAFAYQYDGNVVDIYGLNNVAMAHAPGNKHGFKNHAAFNVDVFLMQQPDLFGPTTGSRESLIYAAKSGSGENISSLKDIFRDKRFMQMYTRALISDTDSYVLAWVNRSYVARLIEQGLEVKEFDNQPIKRDQA